LSARFTKQGCWGPIMRWGLALCAAAVAMAGCGTTKREMRPPKSEDFELPAPGQYTNPPDIPRDAPLLTPKTTPTLNTNSPGRPGVSGPMPATPSTGSPR
jgi:hypothetical protein